MKPNYSVILFLLIFNFAMQGFARAGGISDGGGNAVVCRDQDKKIISATLLDLYEAEKIYKLKPSALYANQTYLEIARDVAKKIDAGGAGVDVTSVGTVSADGVIVKRSFGISGGALMHKKVIQNNVEYISAALNLIPDVGLSPIDDSNSLIRPKNCEIVQTAIYLDDSSEIHVVEEIWNAFDQVSKAGLLVHEALYRNMRSEGETNSDRTRRAVGYAFSGGEFKNTLDQVPSATIVCGTDEGPSQYRFAVYEETTGVATLQFFILNGKIPFAKTTVKVPINQSPIGQGKSDLGSSTYIGYFAESLFEQRQAMAVSMFLHPN